MVPWKKELLQAFQEAVIRGQPFMVLDIQKRLQQILPAAAPEFVAQWRTNYNTVKCELLSLMERDRPSGWALTTIPVVDENGTPHNVWQFTPIATLEAVERIYRPKMEDLSRTSLLRRILSWSGLS